MIRKIIQINEDLCNGCGACAAACHEGAIEMVQGKAKLIREDYCDGLGDCLPHCPTGAITFEMREAAEYDERAVQAHLRKKQACQGFCPGTAARTVSRSVPTANCEALESCLLQWPVQLKLVPVFATYLDGADLLIAADCTAYAYGNFHREFMRNRITLIGCPKLDEGDYAEKLTAIFAGHEIKSVTVVRMEVPCCGGIEFAVQRALESAEKEIPFRVVTITTDGDRLE